MEKFFLGRKNKKFLQKRKFSFLRVGLSMLWGNCYYVYMARKLAHKEDRGDVCTMPYGINTPGACNTID